MISIFFKTFIGPEIDFQFSGVEYSDSKSSITIIFKKDEKLSRLAILKEFYRILTNNGISFIKPLNGISGEWVVILSEFKQFFIELKDIDYLKGAITIEPDFDVNEHIPIKWIDYDYDTQEKYKKYASTLKFHIDPADQPSYFIDEQDINVPELTPFLKKFRIDYPNPMTVGFIMMKFDNTKLQNEIINALKLEGRKIGINFVRADDKQYSDELLSNIRTYMHGCGFGIAIFERLTSDVFNPNVSLEVGYMMAMKKPILFLKDSTLKSLHTDLVSKLYEEFDTQNTFGTIPNVLSKWLKNFDLLP